MNFHSSKMPAHVRFCPQFSATISALYYLRPPSGSVEYVHSSSDTKLSIEQGNKDNQLAQAQMRESGEPWTRGPLRQSPHTAPTVLSPSPVPHYSNSSSTLGLQWSGEVEKVLGTALEVETSLTVHYGALRLHLRSKEAIKNLTPSCTPGGFIELCKAPAICQLLHVWWPWAGTVRCQSAVHFSDHFSDYALDN